MIVVPFVYFSLFSFFLYHKKGKKIDLSVIITAMFAVSGFFSILVDLFELRYPDAIGYNISVGATTSYCLLLTLCILPIAKYSHLGITRLNPVRNGNMLKALAFVSIIWLFATFVFGWSSFMRVLNSNMEEARAAVYLGGAEFSLDNVPTLLRPIMVLLNVIFGCSWIFIFLAFFSRYVQRQPTIFFWMFLFVSLSGPFIGVIGADRSKVTYWIIAAFGIFMLYKPYLQKTEKKKLLIIGVTILSVLVLYLAMMTISRFADRNYGGEVSGTEGGVISYLGQSYIHYCLYFDTYNPPFANFGILFPFTGKYLLGIETGGVVIQEQMSLLTGYKCGVFYTYIGQIIMGAGKTVAIIFCIVYSIFSFITLSSITKKNNISILSLYLYFSIASVQLLGLFIYYYTSPYITFSLFFFYFFLRLIR